MKIMKTNEKFKKKMKKNIFKFESSQKRLDVSFKEMKKMIQQMMILHLKNSVTQLQQQFQQ